jgi:hypothetical protein
MHESNLQRTVEEMQVSEAIYYKGLTIECDSSVPRLTIEGRKVPVELVNDLFISSELPNDKTKTLRELAQKVVDHSPELKSREAAKQEHLAILKKGVEQWNEWRRNHPEIRPILYETDLSRKTFEGDLSSANFANAVLVRANLGGAILRGANFHEANLGGASLSWADLTEANFCRTDLYETDLSHAILKSANLQGTQLAKTNFEEATLDGCKIYGLSAWDLKLDRAIQKDLIVLYKENTLHDGEPEESRIIVDDLRSAQFIYLLLHNKNIRDAIDALTSKVVLILGRFTEERKAVLDAIREELRRRDFAPVLFDFDKPASKDVTGTVEMLARMARFIIADLTDPSSIPHELATIVPFLRTTPVLPLRLAGSGGYSMFDDLQRAYPWVLDIHEYDDGGSLISALPKVIAPADEMAEKLRKTP